MAKQKRQIEYRYYEIPSDQYVLALLGDKWIQSYGEETGNMRHFHNYLEVGYCYWGSGRLIIDEATVNYKGGIITLIPENIPHDTKSDEGGVCKWEYLFIDIDNFIKKEMQFHRLIPEEVIKRINSQGYVIHWSKNKQLTNIVRSIIEEYREQKPYYKQAVKGYLRAFVAEMLRLNENLTTSLTLEEKRLNGYIERSVNYFAEHFAEDVKMSDVAYECGLSESHFRRIFEETMSMKPLDYLNMVRIDNACELIKNKDYGMEEVGYRVGYQTPSTFNRNFKKLTGKTPYQWKMEESHFGSTKKNYKISAKKGW
ncbi:AraC family transcriptional regulator [Pseudobutyrivibrio sp.]|uniref:AraC family transcriptional regulator n=1 Tax=Pseudobutyrivibrio sp. TaxID=2014367 RepID=UPI001E001676|nr:AraC family transcriptional regulator [Pseudobutyrivibrio sp.]MBE5911701.1 AraC family transcriptional regulator [Pseudobutyrivibrio sp.]